MDMTPELHFKSICSKYGLLEYEYTNSNHKLEDIVNLVHKIMSQFIISIDEKDPSLYDNEEQKKLFEFWKNRGYFIIDSNELNMLSGTFYSWMSEIYNTMTVDGKINRGY